MGIEGLVSAMISPLFSPPLIHSLTNSKTAGPRLFIHLMRKSVFCGLGKKVGHCSVEKNLLFLANSLWTHSFLDCNQECTLIGMPYALPKGVLIGILILYIGMLTGTHYKKNLAYRNLSSLIRRSNTCILESHPLDRIWSFDHWAWMIKRMDLSIITNPA